MAETENSKPIVSNATVEHPSFIKELITYGIREEIEPRMTDLFRNLIVGSINMVADAASKTVDKAVYKNGSGPKRVTKGVDVGEYHPKVNYSVKTYSTDSNSLKSQPQKSINSRPSTNVNYIWVDAEEDARRIINELAGRIEKFGKAKVSDLYDMVGEKCNFTDYKFGWTKEDLPNMGYNRDRGKYFIDLPEPSNIENA